MEKKYFKLQLKSIFKVFPTILLITILTIVSIGATCTLMLKRNQDEKNAQKISLGLVGDLNDSFLGIGIHMLENVDDARFYVEVTEMDEKEAIDKLEKREISGYVYIPKNYIRNIYSGVNNPAKYITLNEPTGFGSIISDEVALMVSDIVTESQNGMYNMQQVVKDFNTNNRNKSIDKLVVSYMDKILGRKEMYEVTTLGMADSLSFAGYYICGILVLFLLLWGVSCNRIFTMKNTAHARLLRMSGMKGTKQVFCEYMAYLLVTVSTLLVFSVVAGVVIQNNDFGIPELMGWGITDCAWLVVKILPVIFMITMMQVAIYELITNTVGAILAQFLISIFLGYLSGCFYPNYFFPEMIQNIASYLPVGAGFAYVRQAMAGSISVRELGFICVYIIMFAFVAIRMRNYKITGDIK